MKEPTWEELCMRYVGRVLTGRYAHECWDWDGLPVDETTNEWPCACADKIHELDAEGKWLTDAKAEAS